MDKYILGIDIGTTSLRTLAYNTRTHEFENINQVAIKSFFSAPSCVEQDALQIVKDVKKCLSKTIKNFSEDQIIGVGLTNQRETVVLWNKETCKPIYNALVWQDKRTLKICEKYNKDKVIGKKIRNKTGLICDAYFSASKISWMLKNVPDVKKLLKEHKLCVGTLEAYVVYYLTQGKSFVTDHTNASRTMLYNIKTFDYDDDLLKLWNIPREILPKIINNDEIVGSIKIDKKTIKIGGIIGDQQSSLFGQGCFDVGDGKITYGTGAFILFNIGKKFLLYDNGLLTTVGWKIKNNISYAIECSIYNAGSCITWMKDQIGLISSVKEVETIIKQVDCCGGVSFVPALSGLGAPYWKNNVKGEFVGLTTATTKAHMVRAVLCGVAYNVKSAFDEIKNVTNLKLSQIKVDGGMVTNDTFVQIQSDLLDIPILCSKESESTSLGAVFMCGLACGFYKDFEALKNEYRVRKTFYPKQNEVLKKEFKQWQNIIKINK